MASSIHETFRPTGLTVLMVLVGTILGTLVCMVNLYFGWQSGSVNTMSAATASISYTVFKGTRRWRVHTFGPPENVIIQTIASSIAGMPLAASLMSVIPAFEFLRTPEEGGRVRLPLPTLILWSLGVCLFGTVFAAPFRNYFLLRQRLRFPGGFATGVLIGVLHNDSEILRRANIDKKGLLNLDVDSSNTGDVETCNGGSLCIGESCPCRRRGGETVLILKTFGITSIYVMISYFVPVVKNLPVFGHTAARDWLWCLNLSPAFAAFGMILDLPTACSMLIGAILGWGVLSSIVKSYDWAPGPVESTEAGVRGWFIWISIACLVGDASMRVLTATKGIVTGLCDSVASITTHSHSSNGGNSDDNPSRQSLLSENRPAPGDIHRTDGITSGTTISAWLIGSSILCIVLTSLSFPNEVSGYTVAVAIALAFPFCLIILQCTGETDTAPSSSISNISQLLFHLIMPPTAIARLATMIPSAVMEGGLWQSAVLMTDLKTAYLVRASPKAMFHVQLLGSIIGSFIGSILYRLLTRLFTIPSTDFPVPLAYMWVTTARAANGHDVPNGVLGVAVVAFTVSAFFRMLSIHASQKAWRRWVPSGVAISIGMYVVPSVTVTKFLGALLRAYALRFSGISEATLLAAATGCILAEGVIGFAPLVMQNFGVPRLG
ncbi:OPT oligopeptide transporter protein-domain-containing protein [Xylaria sp. FL0064]|nr:OPT oligopeptide transporter protein-domain-containing protein [Xylaria sp. FL0064]